MIEYLTPEQEAQCEVYKQKWIKIGLCTDPADRSRGEAAIRWMYHHANLPQPKIVWCDSPLISWIMFAIVEKMSRESTSKPVMASVVASVYDIRASVGAIVDIVGASVRDSVYDIRASVGAIVDSVRDSVGDSVGASVRDSVYDIRASVGAIVDSVRDRVRDIVGASVRDIVYGQHDAGFLAFYDFFGNVCGLKKETSALHGLLELAHSANWALPRKHICFVSERPRLLHLNDRGQLHRDGGMALQYPDGWGIYALNGVQLEPWMAETSACLDPTQVLAVTNAEQRRELIRKVGVERLLAHLPHTILDQTGDGMYELLSIRFSDTLTDARVLKMRNPSIGVWHLERVEDGLTTVEQALRWRNQDEEPTEVLT